MKKITTILILLIVFAILNGFGQDITGQWNGILEVQGIQLRVVFNITETENGFNSTMDSPDQGAKGIPVTTTTFEDSILNLEITGAGIAYSGKLKESSINGTFKQGGHSFALDLTREKPEKSAVIRPQEPIPPYPYYSEEVTFENEKANITLAGTLTLPNKDGVYPVVVLISGSGAQNRDEELLGHKPFLVLSDHLTKNGIAVLRYDDRGTARSTGDFETATSLDFATNVESAVLYLKTRKEINKKKIGLIGHSEGGIIAPMIASKSKDVNFIVLLAGTGIPGDQLLLLQQELIARVSGVSESEIQKSKEINSGAFEIVAGSNNTEQLKSDLSEYLAQKLKENPDIEKPAQMSEEDFINVQVKQLANPWMQYFIRYNPATILEKVKCPVLAINGKKDLQVPSKINLEAIKTNLEKGGNNKVTIKELPKLNHLFQECNTGSPDEYAAIEQTFSPIALEEVSNWIKIQVE